MGFQRLLLLFALLCAIRHHLGLPLSDICTLTNGTLTCIDVRSHGDFPIVLPYNSNVTSAVIVGTEYLLDFPDYPFEHPSWQYLQKLELQDFVRIEILDENTFLGLWNLIELRLTNFTYLVKIDNSALLLLPKLEILDFGHNANLSFFVVNDLLENTVPNLRQLFLSRINNAADPTHVIGRRFISAIGTKKLTHLDLSGAKIDLIQQRVMESTFANLRYLNLSDTGILWMNDALVWLPNLETLDITRAHYVPMKIIVSQSGNITNLYGKSLKRIYADELILNESDNNNVSVIWKLDEGIPLEILVMKNIKGSKTAYNIFNGLFVNMSKLDLSGGNISYLSQSTLQMFPSLKIVILGGNMLGRMEDTPEFETLFNNNIQLQQLSLAKNGIGKLPEDFFLNNEMLQAIDLHGNHLINFTINLTHLSKIRYLDLRENNLISISKSLIDILERHFKNQSGQPIDAFTCKNLSKVESDFNHESCQELPTPQNLTLNLAGNPFQCDCDNIYFIEWILSTKIDLVSKHSLHCSFMGNNLTMCTESLQFMESMCKGPSTTASGTTIVFILIASVVFFVLVVTAVVTRKKFKRYCVQTNTTNGEQGSDMDGFEGQGSVVEELLPAES